MFETFISSRIRRTLFEHLLSHQTDRFYLRGLARELGLSISPLRRELKRLENSGMLKADQEGNMLFYTVNADSDLLLQLQHVSEPALPGVGPRMPQPQPIPRPIVVPQPAPPGPSLITAVAGRPIEAPSASPVECPAPTPQSTQVGVVSAARPHTKNFGVWVHGPMSHPVLVAATGVGLALMLVVVSLAYMTMTEQRLASSPAGQIQVEKPQVTIVIPPTASVAMPATSSSGVMRGNRWQVVPGGFGGFSAGAADESY